MCTPSAFPSIQAVGSTFTHTHTVIALHGRGSQGPDFAKELLEGQTSAGKTLQELLPSYKWVFPSSQKRYSTVFQEEMDEWFDIYSLTDPSAREELQVGGLRDSVGFLLQLIRNELEHLDGDPSRLIIIGISQGCATGLLAVLAGQCKLGGFVGLSGWMPFRAQIEEIGKKASVESVTREELGTFLKSTIGRESDAGAQSFVGTPVLLCHAVDDEMVDIGLNRQACAALKELGMGVESMEYRDGGHWINEPKGYDDIVAFLARESSEQ